MKSVNCSKPGINLLKNLIYIPFTCNLICPRKFNDSSFLFTIISWVYLNLSLADEYVGDVTIPTQVIKYN
jgi:hypothetical protein